MSIIKKFNKALDNIGNQRSRVTGLNSTNSAKGSERFTTFKREKLQDGQRNSITPASAALRSVGN